MSKQIESAAKAGTPMFLVNHLRSKAQLETKDLLK
jgi:hypothetical protein